MITIESSPASGSPRVRRRRIGACHLLAAWLTSVRVTCIGRNRNAIYELKIWPSRRIAAAHGMASEGRRHAVPRGGFLALAVFRRAALPRKRHRADRRRHRLGGPSGPSLGLQQAPDL